MISGCFGCTRNPFSLSTTFRYLPDMKRRNFLKITLPLALAGKASAAPATEPDLTFGVIADPQYADADSKWGRF